MRKIPIYTRYLFGPTVLILLLSPVPCYATGPGQAVGFLMIGAFTAAFANFLKFLILRGTRRAVISLETLGGVAVTEAILIYGAYVPLFCLLVLLRLIGLTVPEDLLHSVGMKAWVGSFALCAIIPNIFLIKAKNEKVSDAVLQPKKITCAALMGLITPTLTLVLISYAYP